MRLRLRHGRYGFNAIYFSATAESASIVQGDLVDVAFMPQINDFKGERSVQMNVMDIRPSCTAECSWQTGGYQNLCHGQISGEEAKALLPDRALLGKVWKYLEHDRLGLVEETPMCLCRKIVRWTGAPMSLGQLLTCLDIFADVELIELRRQHRNLSIRLLPRHSKADLNASATMQRLQAAAKGLEGCPQ
jgi:single-stranded-DNA-specific exonuclease